MPSTPTKPFPQPDSASTPFFQALRDRRLLVQRCVHCGLYALGSYRCRTCRHAVEWQPASGRGVVYTHTRVHLAYHPAFESHVPYDVVLVALAEGPHLIAGFRDERRRGPHPGMPLVVAFESANDTWLPYFVPEEPAHRSGVANNLETP